MECVKSHVECYDVIVLSLSLSLSLSPSLLRPDDDDDSVSAGCAKISQFFAPKSQDTSKKKHRFFEERGLKNVMDF